MAIFDYECKWCGWKIMDIPQDEIAGMVCPKCDYTEFRKLPAAPAVHFKGSGWYETDYKKKED